MQRQRKIYRRGVHESHLCCDSDESVALLERLQFEGDDDALEAAVPRLFFDVVSQLCTRKKHAE